MSYCASRFHTVRRPTLEVSVGAVGVGGSHPLRLQSMTTSDTQDVVATVRQAIALAEVGCEIVRVTAPNQAAARCLRDIRAGLDAAGFRDLPLVADIHFLPQAALEAVEHVEKVRINPGNYADKKKFAIREYSDADYERELARLHDAFSPLVRRCLALGRALRIGTNHGSLSDRIMNRYGDTPLGMVESALEFLRIAESHGFRQIILSMKASNPKVMIQAYRLLVARMAAENMHYPLHLGVTEAGDGEDGRIKSAIGIGSLLLDGLGDTLRVSLTEDSVYEIPVARALADKATSLWTAPVPEAAREVVEALDPFQFSRREARAPHWPESLALGPPHPPRVLVRSTPAAWSTQAAALAEAQRRDNPVEGVVLPIAALADLAALDAAGAPTGPLRFLELAPSLQPEELAPWLAAHAPVVLVRSFQADEVSLLRAFVELVRAHGHFLACDLTPASAAALVADLRALGPERLLLTHSGGSHQHAVGAYRALAAQLSAHDLPLPLWIRNTTENAIQADPSFLSKLLEASILTGSLLADGLGDLVSLETETDPTRAARLAYNILQGAGARLSKTEFVACPSCGRTLFDLQTTTQRIRAQTGHLKGVKIAIMGCIVNGPGEMADADFGYVGGAPGKINLYVGKTCVQYNIPQAEADARLIALIREHGKWIDPETPAPLEPASTPAGA